MEDSNDGNVTASSAPGKSIGYITKMRRRPSRRFSRTSFPSEPLWLLWNPGASYVNVHTCPNLFLGYGPIRRRRPRFAIHLLHWLYDVWFSSTLHVLDNCDVNIDYLRPELNCKFPGAELFLKSSSLCLVNNSKVKLAVIFEIYFNIRFFFPFISSCWTDLIETSIVMTNVITLPIQSKLLKHSIYEINDSK